MIVKDVINTMESLAPSYLIDKWDNCGFQIGSINKSVKKILLSLDVTPSAISKAIEKNVDMIITHHPMIFDPLNNIITETQKGTMIYELIKNDIAIYSAHSNLDVCGNGISNVLANILDIKVDDILLQSYQEQFYKLVVFVPKAHSGVVRDAISEAGAGWIGKYSHCTYNLEGIGTFMPRENTNPFIGEEGVVEEVEETKIETIIRKSQKQRVIEAMLEVHPYEEVAYDIYPLDNEGEIYGYGRVGYLNDITNLSLFSNKVKNLLNCDNIRVYGDMNKSIKRVAICGGSGGDFVEHAYKAGADVYVTGDIKYHDAQLAQELGVAIIDANHYDTEKVILPFLREYISNNFEYVIEDIIIHDENHTPFIVS